MIIKQYRQFNEGLKTQTRRVVVSGTVQANSRRIVTSEYFDDELMSVMREKVITDIMGRYLDSSLRIKYRVGYDYPVIPKRGARRLLWHPGNEQYSVDGASDEYAEQFGKRWLQMMRIDGWKEVRLIIDAVRQESLQDICGQGALAEGLLPAKSFDFPDHVIPPGYYADIYGYWSGNPYAVDDSEYLEAVAGNMVAGYENLWRSINTKPGVRWEDNPQVWVYDIEKLLR